jgi:protocatechuate 3,4-dioxygenase beta subunit
VLLAGCTGPTQPPSGTATSTPSPRGPSACAVADVGTAESASVLSPGPSNGLAATDAKGERLVIHGMVVSATCAPLAGASLDIWHTDSRGDYGPRGTEQCCYYQGSVLTDPFGRFRLESIRPAQYPQPNAPPAHVHLEIRSGFTSLTTEITFIDASGPPAASSSTVIPVNLTRVRDAGGETWSGKVVFVLPG